MTRFGWLHNEKGGGWLFTFALVMVLVIAVMTPTMLNLISNRNLTDVKIKQEKMVNQLAIGGIETFIAYLKDYRPTQGSKVNYFKNYPGWGVHQITTPEGKKLTYELSLEGTSVQSVTSRLTPYTLVLESSSTQPFSYEKQMKYKVVIFEKNPLLDPNNAVDQVISPDEVGGTIRFGELFEQLVPTRFDKEYSDFDDLQAYIDGLSENTIPSELIVKIKVDNQTSIKSNYDFTKIPKLVIYVDDDLKTNGNRSFLMNGMLLVDGDLNGGASSLKMDNLITNGELSNVGGTVQSTVAILDLRKNVGGNDRGKGVGNEALNVALDPILEYDYLNQSASDGWGIERTN